MLEALLEDLELRAPALVTRRQVMQFARQHIGDVMFLVALEDDVARLGVVISVPGQRLLLDQLVEFNSVVSVSRRLFACSSSARGFFPLLQQP